MEAAFDEEAGDISSLATAAQKQSWFNQGQTRLVRWCPVYEDISWAAAARTLTLAGAATFVQLDKITNDQGVNEQPWRVWGQGILVIDDPAGASSAGSARIYYWRHWVAVTNSVSSELTPGNDYACLYYALSRFYKRLSSNRAYYKRYATLVGQNAVSMSDLQQEADRWEQDFLDAREDQTPDPPTFFYPN